MPYASELVRLCMFFEGNAACLLMWVPNCVPWLLQPWQTCRWSRGSRRATGCHVLPTALKSCMTSWWTAGRRTSRTGPHLRPCSGSLRTFLTWTWRLTMTPTVISAAEADADGHAGVFFVFLMKMVDEGQKKMLVCSAVMCTLLGERRQAAALYISWRTSFSCAQHTVHFFPTGWAAERMKACKFQWLVTAQKETAHKWFLQLLCNSCIRSQTLTQVVTARHCGNEQSTEIGSEVTAVKTYMSQTL